MRRSRGLVGLFLEQGTRALSRAAGTVLADPRGQELVARAVGLAQRGKERFERMEARALRSVGLASRPDTQDLARRLARLKRQLRELSKDLEARKRGGRGP